MDKRILLVDDEKDIRDVLRLPLADLGYEVLEAENGEDALHVFKAPGRRSSSRTSKCQAWTASSCCRRSSGRTPRPR